MLTPLKLQSGHDAHRPRASICILRYLPPYVSLCVQYCCYDSLTVISQIVVLRAITETVIIATGASFVAAVLPVVYLGLYFVQKYYLRTSRQMRLLDLETKSPLYTQFTETLAGLSTIRAFGWSTDFMHDNRNRLNSSQIPFYMMFCIQRWLQVVLDLFAAGMALVLVSFAVKLSSSTSKGAIGLAMVNIIGFNLTLTAVIDQWTSLETSLGAIARLKWFMKNTPNENKETEVAVPSVDWPAQGLIELVDVTASYRSVFSVRSFVMRLTNTRLQ